MGLSGESSLEYGNKITRYSPDSAQVLFTESPKVTVTTSSPYGSRRNLQTTRFSTGRTSFTSTTTTTTAMPVTEEEESEEEKKEDGGDDNEEDEKSEEEETEGEDHEHNDEEKSSEEKIAPAGSSPQTTTSVYDGKGEDAGSESGESQLKQMLLDSIPPHGSKKDEVDGESTKDEEEEEGSDDEEMGGMSSSSEFNLSQKIRTTTVEPSTTTAKPPAKTTKPPKQRGDTISRLISRNFTRKTTSTTTESSGSGSSETETQTDKPSTTTVGPAGHKYDFTITPNQRGKLKTKSTESVEQEVTVATKPPPKYTLKQRFRSTTVKPLATPEPPSTAAPRTRGTSSPVTSTEFGIKQGSKRGSVESPIDIVPSPDLSPKGQLKQQLQKLKEQREKEKQKSQPNSFEGVDLSSASSEEKGKTSSEQQFLDVLVGADDQKTLVTKKTEDGIVTSAILPPWYDANGANSSISDVLAMNSTTMSNAVAKVAIEDDAVENSGENSFGEKMTIVKKKSSAEEKSGALNNSGASKEKDGPSEFERLVNMFSNQEQSSEDIPAPPPANRFGFKKQKPVVLKKPGGSLNSRFIRPDPARTNLFPQSSSSSSKETKSSENISNGPSPASPEAEATTNLERPPGDVGRTGVLPTAADVEDPADMPKKYYPENHGDHDKVVVEQQMVESEPLASDEMMDSPEEEQGNPSHVIDVNIDDTGDNPAEVIISEDNSAPLEDEEGDFVEDEDYSAYGDNPPTLSMSASAPNQNVVLPPDDYVLKGSGIRRPMSSEEFNEGPSDMDPSASAPVENSVSTTTTTETPQVLSAPAPVAAIRRPAYTREEIAKAVVKPSPGSLGENNLNDGLDNDHHLAPTGSMEEEFEDEYEDDENYDGGSVEQPLGGGGSLEHWSSERTGTPGSQKWSAPDKMMDAVEGEGKRPLTLSEELTEHEEHVSAESIAHPTVQHNVPLNSLENPIPQQQQPIVNQVENSTKVFRPPQLVSFHENKLSFSPPAQLDGEYHSKDGWRPVLSNKTPGEGGSSLEAVSGQVGSYEHEEDEHEQEHEYEEPQQLFQEPPQQLQPPQQPHIFQEPPTQQQLPHAFHETPTQQQPHTFHEPSIEEEAHIFQELPIQQQHQIVDPTPTQQVQPPPPQQQWAHEQPSPPQLKHKQMMHRAPHPPPQQHSVIPPPMPATIKFPDSEEDHEDRRHHGRRPRPGQGRFDRAKYMTRPVAPPIVMRRRPHSGGPFPPPPGLKNRQGPPPPHQGPPPPHQGPPPPHQRPPPPQMMQQAGSQQNPQYTVEHPPHPQSPPPPGRPPHPAINRNFHMRPNPMRRFNFGGGGGGPPQAQPRSGGNIKWPTDDGEVSRGDGENSSQQQNLEGAQSEVSINKRRRRRKRAVIAA